jgi:PBP1b-binding outer membrane lipoprotein LpoB
MKTNYFILLSLSFLLAACSTEEATPTYQSQEKISEDRTQLIEAIIANPDFILGFNKFLKDKPSNGKIARIEFWLDTLINQKKITQKELNALNLRAGAKLETFSSTFSRKFQVMDSLFQDATKNNQPITEATINKWESDTNKTLGIDESMLAKHAAHHEYTANLASLVEKEGAARQRLSELYPQLKDDRFVAKCIEYYYSNL